MHCIEWGENQFSQLRNGPECGFESEHNTLVRWKNHSHLTKDERNEIYSLKTKGYSLRVIAAAVGRSVSTISDELSRNCVAGIYDPRKAHTKSQVRRKASKFQGKKLVDNQQLLAFVEPELLKLQSPQAISGRLKTGQDGLPYVSRDTIEEYVRSAHGCRLEYQL